MNKNYDSKDYTEIIPSCKINIKKNKFYKNRIKIVKALIDKNLID